MKLQSTTIYKSSKGQHSGLNKACKTVALSQETNHKGNHHWWKWNYNQLPFINQVKDNTVDSTKHAKQSLFHKKQIIELPFTLKVDNSTYIGPQSVLKRCTIAPMLGSIGHSQGCTVILNVGTLLEVVPCTYIHGCKLVHKHIRQKRKQCEKWRLMCGTKKESVF